MKSIITALLIFIGIFLLFYLAGSFYAVSFSLKDWPEATRGLVSIFGTIIGGMVGVAYLSFSESEQK